MTTRLLVILAGATALALVAAFVLLPRLSGPALPPLPASAQTLERHDLAPQLRRRIEQALEAQGLTTTPRTEVVVGPSDCPETCSAGMDRGLCYCLRDDSRNCPAGWPLEQGDSRSACASLPDRVRLRPDGPETAEQVISF
jgi:hypothetical protein